MQTAGDLVDPSSITLDNVKSSLYCVRCNRILRDAVEVSCCHALYCVDCVHPEGRPYNPAKMDLIHCFNCEREILEAPVANFPVRRLVATIPVPCTNEGCKEIIAAGSMQDHVLKHCDYGKVGCKYFHRGCAATMLRKDAIEHEKSYCIFRDVSCPQSCGLVMQWRECADHMLHVCTRTLVDCTVKCGAMVERRSLFQHMNECPMKPLPCPYRSIGCTMDKILRRPDLEDHMAMSVHAHLQLVDAKMRSMESQCQKTAMSLRRPSSHDWDPGHVKCVARWDAQRNNIYAMAIVDGFIVTGCEAGVIMVFHPFSGDVIRSVQTGDEPIRSILALGDGRVVVGRKFHSVLLYANVFTELIASVVLHPKDLNHSVGVLSLSTAQLSKHVHLTDRPQFLHPELYAVPTCAEDMLQGVFDVVFAATEHHVRVLDAATLEEFEHIDGYHAGSVTCCVIHDALHDTFLLTGSKDGSVRIHDLRSKGFPQKYWLQCFGGCDGVSALCIHPNGAQWRDGAVHPNLPPDEDKESPVVLCIGGGDGSVGFWDFQEKMSCDYVIERGHRGAILCMLPVDGSLIASGGADEYWRAWNGKAETSYADLPGSMYCAVANNNMLFAAGSQGCVRVWTSATLRYNEKRQSQQKKQTPL